MKKIVLALSIASVALTVTASSRSEIHERNHWLGRHEYNGVDVPQANVPESAPTLALVVIAMAALSFVAIAGKRQKA